MEEANEIEPVSPTPQKPRARSPAFGRIRRRGEPLIRMRDGDARRFC